MQQGFVLKSLVAYSGPAPGDGVVVVPPVPVPVPVPPVPPLGVVVELVLEFLLLSRSLSSSIFLSFLVVVVVPSLLVVLVVVLEERSVRVRFVLVVSVCADIRPKANNAASVKTAFFIVVYLKFGIYFLFGRFPEPAGAALYPP